MGGTPPPSRGQQGPVYDPAGHDDALRQVLADVRAGHWVPMRNLLVDTGADWDLRTSRSQVLAAVSAKSDLVRTWLAEEPDSTEAVLMQARVAVERAVRAQRGSKGTPEHERLVERLEDQARNACRRAEHHAPQDPVPWVCRLALAQVDVRRRWEEHRQPPPDPMLPSGPWGLLHQVWLRHPCNREGFHRVLQWLCSPAGSHQRAFDYTLWVTSWAPAGTALQVMPLYAYAEHYRYRRQRGHADPLMHRQWAREDIRPHVRKALRNWFEQAAPGARLVMDLNYLAHALWAGNLYREGARVFEALWPFATRLPWAYVCEAPEQLELATAEFTRARNQCFAAAGLPNPHQGARW